MMTWWWFLLLRPNMDSSTGLVNYADEFYTMSWWCLFRRRYWCRLLHRSARRRRCHRGDDLLCLCASPASCWWTSTTPMMGFSSPAPMPSELDKQFLSAKWTLEDDLMILLLRCRTWLDLTLYIVMIFVFLYIRTSRPSVCHYNIRGAVQTFAVRPYYSDVCIYPHLICIYLVFNLNQRARAHPLLAIRVANSL